MKVKQRMTPGPITAHLKNTHSQALTYMRQHRFRRMPVLDDDNHLVGIVSEKDLLRTAPSPATSLSVYEIYTLIEQLTLDQIMTHPVYAVEGDCEIDLAARVMLDKRIGCLPVMEGEHLIGIITETDIFRAFVELLGGGESGIRLDVQVDGDSDVLARITRAVANAGGDIVSLATFHGDDCALGEISLKERGAEPDQLRHSLDGITGIQSLNISLSVQNGLLEFGR
jgi:acetoin utilization protein AcuB